MNYIFQIFKGILIGMGAILPGVSSGVICVTLGIYEKLLNSVLDFFSNVKENFKFLFPICFGIIIGIICFSNVLKYLFSNYNIPFSFCVSGLICGGIPKILRNAKITKFKPFYLLALLLSLSFSIFLFVIHRYGHIYVDSNDSQLSFVFAGFAMSAGIIIPGVSSTVILMLLGKYNSYLSAISSVNLSVLFPMGIGLICGSIILLFFTKFMFMHFKSITYFSIIGFMLGSVPIIIPNIANLKMLFTGIIFFLLGFLLSIKLSALH